MPGLVLISIRTRKIVAVVGLAQGVGESGLLALGATKASRTALSMLQTFSSVSRSRPADRNLRQICRGNENIGLTQPSDSDRKYPFLERTVASKPLVALQGSPIIARHGILCGPITIFSPTRPSENQSNHKTVRQQLLLHRIDRHWLPQVAPGIGRGS